MKKRVLALVLSTAMVSGRLKAAAQGRAASLRHLQKRLQRQKLQIPRKQLKRQRLQRMRRFLPEEYIF